MKKRQHPDEPHLSSSLPKRPLVSSEAQSASSLDQPVVSSSAGCAPSQGSITAPSLFNLECTTRLEQSSLSTSTARYAPNFRQSSISGDFASYKFGPLTGTREPPQDGQAKQKKFCGPFISSNHRSMVYEVEVSAGTVSELTVDRSVYAPSSSGGPRYTGNVTHVISRRDTGSSSSKLVSDEPWHKVSCGYGDYATWGRQEEKSGMILGSRESRGIAIPPTGCESGTPYLTEESLFGAKHGFVNVYGSACTERQEPSMAYNLAVSKPHQSIGWTDYRDGHRLSSSEVLSQSFVTSDGVSRCSISESFPQAYMSSDRECEESGASYVLSSGRLSLEEEARLGRRPPTIDHDFEEYFAALML